MTPELQDGEHRVMKVVLVNVGLPREVAWKDRMVKTGIFLKNKTDRSFKE
jgi:hypothetical protein